MTELLHPYWDFIDNSNEWINWIEDTIEKKHIKYYDYKNFDNNIQVIGSGDFGKVYRANWKSSHHYLTLKSFFKFDNFTLKEIINELKLQREVDFHENIIRFCGIMTGENQNDNSKKYLLVMEYADSGTLRNYLSERFENLTWNDKLNLAFQLAHAVLCLHDEGIVHRDLSDIYSIGILLWEISSGRPPFKNDPHDVCLAIRIVQGLREEPIPNTPKDYIEIYTENHFIITNELVGLLDNVYLEIKKHKILNYFNSCNVTLQEFYNWLLSNQEDSNLVVLLGIFNHLGIETEVDEQNVFKLYKKAADLGNTSGINSLGVCYQYGIGTICDKKKAVKLYQKAADLGNSTSICNLGYCYQYGIGTNMDKERAFITFQKAANLGNACGIYNLGHCYRYGIGIIKNYPKSVVLYQNAADLGDALAQYFLAMIYERGEEDIIDIDTYHIDLIYGRVTVKDIDIDKAIYWYEKCKNVLCKELNMLIIN
ncbi:hypothetical protein RclHR1_01120024 [Rhizophagus clarus]|uniref:Protein kinase domain-containing protein n=1 Tax=Rhizophagus clarus TaxID=94130 RepID=A0A2Z6QWL9_9GLOM|nr:hypothetical protein RclHR1_01120024 [Rhizophagus clarus]